MEIDFEQGFYLFSDMVDEILKYDKTITKEQAENLAMGIITSTCTIVNAPETFEECCDMFGTTPDKLLDEFR